MKYEDVVEDFEQISVKGFDKALGDISGIGGLFWVSMILFIIKLLIDLYGASAAEELITKHRLRRFARVNWRYPKGSLEE